MHRQTSLKVELFASALRMIILGVLAVFACLVLLLSYNPVKTSAATNGTLNFQARLESNTGAIAPDGIYNVQFKLYDASTGGTNLWTESYLNSASQGVTVTNGYLTVNLGSITSFPTTINWDQDLYVTMNIGGTTGMASWDGEMNPRLKLTAVPYAFQAKSATQLQQTQGAYSGTLNFNTLTDNRTISLPDENGTVCLQASAGCGFLTASVANGSYIQLQGGTPGTAQHGNFNIDGTGIAATLQGTSGVSTGAGSGTQRIDGNGNLVNIGTVSTSGNITSGGTVSTTAGGAAGVGTQQLASNLYVQSRGENLVTNGTGLLGNNYNFSGFTFDPQNTYTGAGSFKNSTEFASALSDELIPVDPSSTYQLSLAAKATTYVAGAHAYFGVSIYDADGLEIEPYMYFKYPGSTDTTLAAPLNPGDTTMTLTNAAGWSNSATGYTRNFTWYGYTNGKGYTYPDYTYSRTGSELYSDFGSNGAWAVGGISGNVVTLRSPWSGPALSAGAAIRNNQAAATYKYITTNGSNVNVPATWTTYAGRISGIDTNGTGSPNMFSYGTAYVKLVFLLNRDVAGNTTNVSDISFTNNSGVFTAPTSSSVPVIVQGAAAQSVDLLQVQNSVGTVLSKFDANGNLVVSATGASSFAGSLSVGGQTVFNGSGILQTAAVSGSYMGITAVGTLTGLTTSGVITSTVANGTAPLVVSSSTLVTNLNADLLDGLHSTDFAPASGSSKYIQLQATTPGVAQTGNFNINGTGIAGVLQSTTLAVSGNSTMGSSSPLKQAQLSITNTNGAQRGLVIQGASGQSVDLLDFYDSSGSFVSGYDSSGNIYANGTLNLGTSSAAGTINLKDGTGHTVTVRATGTTSDYSITLPSAVGNAGDCLKANNGSGALIFGTCAAGSTGVTLQATTPGTADHGNFNIDGTGIAAMLQGTTSVLTPLLDTPTAGVLNIGTTNATAINLNKNVTVAAGQSLTITGGSTGSRPASPTPGTLYYDTTTKQLLVYTNNKWQASAANAMTKVVADASTSQNPDSADFVVPVGSTSAQTTINAAIAALPATGGTLYLEEGTYIVSDSINVPSNVIITGAGAATILKVKDSLNTSINVITNADTTNGNNRITLQNFKIDGNKANQTTGTINGISLTKVGSGSGVSALPGIKVSGLFIENVPSNGITLTTVANSSINNTSVQSSGGIGLQMNATTYTSINSSIFQGNNGNAVTANATSSGLTLANNIFQGNSGIALLIAGSNDTISGNQLMSNGGAAIILNNGANGITVTGNSVIGNTGIGISINVGTSGSSNNNSIMGNTVNSNTLSGISIDGGTGTANNNVVSGNKLFDNGGSGNNDGIRFVANASGNTIVGNDITDTAGTGYAINISASTDTSNYLSNNRYSGTGATSINDLGTTTIYSGQLNSLNQLVNSSAGTLVSRLQASASNDLFQAQDSSGNALLKIGSTGTLTIGRASNTTGTMILQNSSNANTVTLASGVTSSSYQLTLPTAIGTAGQCLAVSSVVSTTAQLGYAACAAGSTGVTLQATTPGTADHGNFNIDGTGIAATLQGSTQVQTPLLDTGTAAALNIGTTNASQINLNKYVYVAADQGLEIKYGSTGNANALMVDNASGQLFKVDTVNSNVLVGTEGCSDGLGGGRFCVSQAASGSGTGNLSVSKTTLTVSKTAAGGQYANYTNIIDTSTAIANTIQGYYVDATATTNTAAVVTSYSAKVASGQAGNFLQFQNGASTVLTATNSGNLTATGTVTANALQAGSLDTASAIALNIGTTNATAINLNKNVTVAAGQYISLVGGITSTRPASPTAGMLYYDTTTKSLLVYSNSKWQADRSTATKIVADGSTSQNPDAADFVVPAVATNAENTINSAIAALPAGGGTVYLMEGTYTIDGSINLPSNVTLAGAGPATIIKFKGSLGAGTFNAITNSDTTNGNDHITVRDLKLDGNKANNATGTDSAISFTKVGSGTTVPGAKLSNLWIENFNDSGILLFTSANSNVSNVTVTTFGNKGISFSGVTNSTMSGNTATGSTGSNSVGLQLTGSSMYNTVTGNAVTGNANNGITSIGSSSYNTITGNVVSGNGTASPAIGIELLGSIGSTVSGNTITGQLGGASAFGVFVTNSSSNNTISGNTITSNAGSGIKLDTASGNVISGNKLHDNGSTGAVDSILLNTNASTNTITDNDITDTAGTGYAINISASTDTSNYLSNNRYSGTGATAINDLGTTTIYSGQLNASGQVINSASGALVTRLQTGSSADLLQAQDSSGNALFKVGSTGTVTVGKASTTGTLVVNSASGGTVTLAAGATASGSSYQLTLPTAIGTAGQCLSVASVASGVAQLGYAACSGGGGGSYVTLQGTTPGTADTGNFNVNGSGIASSFLAGTFDTSTATTLNVGTANATSIVIGTASNNMTFDSITKEPSLNGTARHTRRINLSPEFAGATMTADGTNNTGTMTSDNDTTSPFHNFYSWTTTQGTSQDYDIYVRVPLPADFAAWCSTANCNPSLYVYGYDTATSGTSADLQVSIYDTSGAVVGTALSNVGPSSGSSWAESNYAPAASARTWTAGATMTLKFHMTAQSNKVIKLGELRMDYLSKW